MKASAPEVSVGWWYSCCCEEDLYQIKTEEELANLRADVKKGEQDPDGPMLVYDCWPTLDAALTALNDGWTLEQREAIKAAKSSGRDIPRDAALNVKPTAARETEALRAAARAALIASPRWAAVTKDLPPRSIARIGPVDLEACTADELDDIAVWAIGRDVPMPAHLAAYIGAVREATR